LRLVRRTHSIIDSHGFVEASVRFKEPVIPSHVSVSVEPLRPPEVSDADPEVVDHVVAVARTAVVDGLRAVAVRVDQQGAVVLLVVLRPQPRLTVARVAGLRSCAPERVDVLTRACDERDMQAARQRPVFARLRHTEIVPLVEVAARERDRATERCKDGLGGLERPYG
jgi:hypothetical protein